MLIAWTIHTQSRFSSITSMDSLNGISMMSTVSIVERYPIIAFIAFSISSPRSLAGLFITFPHQLERMIVVSVWNPWTFNVWKLCSTKSIWFRSSAKRTPWRSTNVINWNDPYVIDEERRRSAFCLDSRSTLLPSHSNLSDTRLWSGRRSISSASQSSFEECLSIGDCFFDESCQHPRTESSCSNVSVGLDRCRESWLLRSGETSNDAHVSEVDLQKSSNETDTSSFFSTHMHDLQEVTHESHYENYRLKKLQLNRFMHSNAIEQEEDKEGKTCRGRIPPHSIKL